MADLIVRFFDVVRTDGAAVHVGERVLFEVARALVRLAAGACEHSLHVHFVTVMGDLQISLFAVGTAIFDGVAETTLCRYIVKEANLQALSDKAVSAASGAFVRFLGLGRLHAGRRTVLDVLWCACNGEDPQWARQHS